MLFGMAPLQTPGSVESLLRLVGVGWTLPAVGLGLLRLYPLGRIDPDHR